MEDFNNKNKKGNSKVAKQVLQTMIDDNIITKDDGEIHEITTSEGKFIFKVGFLNNFTEEIGGL